MEDIKFSPDETGRIVSKLKRYFEDGLGQEIGSFEAEFLMEFIGKEMGPYFYNRGLADAHALFSEKAEEIGYLVQELEQATS